MQNLPPGTLVFLIDISGSMQSPERLDLVKRSLRLLAGTLRDIDRVSIVVYAGTAGLVLPPTPGTERLKIVDVIDKLEAGGSTAGGERIELAHRTVRSAFIANKSNRVVLATDGGYNLGVSHSAGLERLIEAKRRGRVFLTAMGVDRGYLQDETTSRSRRCEDTGGVQFECGYRAPIDMGREPPPGERRFRQ